MLALLVFMGSWGCLCSVSLVAMMLAGLQCVTIGTALMIDMIAVNAYTYLMFYQNFQYKIILVIEPFIDVSITYTYYS